MVKFGRVMTAMVTPLKEDGSLNYEVAEKLAFWLAENGTDTIVVCGTTGESPTLTVDEEYELFQVVKKGAAGKAKIMGGTGSNSTAEAMAATQKAAGLGLDGSLQVVPYYNKPPQAGLYEHFKAIAQNNPDLPIMLYNVPGRTSCNLEAETVAKLAEIPNIVAIKEASGNLDSVSKIRCLTPPEFSIYSGDDSLTLPILSVGGTGVVSVASHIVGKQLQEMIQAFENGKIGEAQKIHLELFDLFKALFATTNPIPVKTALKLRGWKVGPHRLPLCDPPAEVTEKLKQVLKNKSLL